VDALLDQAAQGTPLVDVADDYQARHRLWSITDPSTVKRIEELMAPKKLLIADGHHRYETALAYRDDHRDNPAAQCVMMTFINMYSPGLRILATHRVLRKLTAFDAGAILKRAESMWKVTRAESLKAEMSASKPELVRFAVVTADSAHLLERARQHGELDVPILHTEILGGLLGISEEAVREESHIAYVRGIEAAIAEVRDKGAQVAFLLDPTPIDDMARIAFAGGVMPQKSTDFYPKMLTGITIYKL
jgi:uncharacterized protein (DUF1015 family)